MKLRRLYEKPWVYDVLVEDETNTYYLDVACGGAAMYTVRIRLTDEEVRDFKQGGSTLDVLARQVSYDPGRFGDRRITIDE
jgi:hypothetical protein